MEIEKLQQRLTTVKSERNSVEQLWMMLERFVVPFRGEFFSDNKSEHEVNWRKRQVYDATAPNSAEMLASSLHGNLTSASSQWFDLGFKQRVDDAEARHWLQQAAKIVFNSINESNFDLKIGEFYLDLCGFNNAFLSFEEENGDYIFDSIPLKQGYFELDHLGLLRAFYRRYEQTNLQILDRFGEEGTPKKIKEAVAGNQALVKQTVVMAIYEREDYDESLDTATATAPQARKYGCKWFLEGCGTQLGEEDGYYEMPVYFVPWRRTSDSQWGNGPSSLALSNILTLNEIVEQVLEGTAKAIDPPIFTTKRNIVGDLDFSRSGLTTVKSLDGMKEFVTGARLDVGASLIEDLRRSVERSFHIDQLLLKESPAMTATEVTVRYELMQKLLGPTLGRIQKNLLNELINRALRIGLRSGTVPPIPDIIKQNQLEYDIIYTGPLPRAQKMQTAMGIQEWLGMSSELSQLFPEAAMVPKVTESVRRIGELRGVPEELMNSEEEVRREQKKQERQAAPMIEAEQAKMQGEALEAMGKGEQMAEAPQNVQ